MILFKPEHMQPIQKGIKTQTRRVWDSPRAKVGSIHKAKLQMLSKDYFAKLHILKIHQEKLGDITPEDAKKEGGYTVPQFKRKWEMINKSWDPELLVYVVEFECIPNVDLKPGDHVRMSKECYEYLTYGDKVWTVASDPYRIGFSELVFLEDFSGGFSTEFLEVVEEDP
jgi:hypothetical protein